MNQIRYRTESFGGSQERDAAKVMAFETFDLGNTDILEHVSKHFLKDPQLVSQCEAIIRELDDNGFVDDIGTADKENFFRQILSAVKEATGIPVKYVLWLADKDVVCDRWWYGRNQLHDNDFDSYEIGPVVLSDLGRNGALYGYTEMPVCLEDRFFILQEELTNIINDRENSRLSRRRAEFLDNRYLEVDAAIQEIDAVLARKSEPDIVIPEEEMQALGKEAEQRLKAQAKDAFRSLSSQIEFAESRRPAAGAEGKTKTFDRE